MEGARRERREQPHNTALDHEQKHPWEFRRGWAGCPLGAWGGRVWHIFTRATRSLACTPCTRCCHRLTTSRCAHSFPQTQADLHGSIPQKGGSPPHRLHSMEDTAQQQGTSFAFFRHREVKREQREALVELRPQPTVCATGPGVWPLLDRGKGQTVARACNSFCLELDSSVLAVGKWFSIESIIFFLSLNIYSLKLYLFVSLGKSASAYSQ